MVIALKRPGSVNAFGRFSRKRRPRRKRQGKKRDRTRLMRKSEKEGPLSVPLLRKKRTAVFQKRRARLSSCTARGSDGKSAVRPSSAYQ